MLSLLNSNGINNSMFNIQIFCPPGNKQDAMK